MNLTFVFAGGAVLAGTLISAGAVYFKKRRKLNRKLSRLLERKNQYKFLLCDVRSAEAYGRGHIPGAYSFPLAEMDYLPVEDMFLTILVYGAGARDTRRAAEYLSRRGYFNVIPYGAFRNWKGAVEKDRGMHVSQYPPVKEPQNGAEISSRGL